MKDEPAYPHTIMDRRAIDGTAYVNDTNYSGLTKREYFAGLAMQGEISAQWCNIHSEKTVSYNDMKSVAKFCVGMADALMAELSKESE